jgi:hypothetical protein
LNHFFSCVEYLFHFGTVLSSVHSAICKNANNLRVGEKVPVGFVWFDRSAVEMRELPVCADRPLTPVLRLSGVRCPLAQGECYDPLIYEGAAMFKIPGSFQDYYCSIDNPNRTSFHGPNAVSRVFSYLLQWSRLDGSSPGRKVKDVRRPGRMREAAAAAKATV